MDFCVGVPGEPKTSNALEQGAALLGIHLVAVVQLSGLLAYSILGFEAIAQLLHKAPSGVLMVALTLRVLFCAARGRTDAGKQ